MIGMPVCTHHGMYTCPADIPCPGSNSGMLIESPPSPCPMWKPVLSGAAGPGQVDLLGSLPREALTAVLGHGKPLKDQPLRCKIAQ